MSKISDMLRDIQNDEFGTNYISSTSRNILDDLMEETEGLDFLGPSFDGISGDLSGDRLDYIDSSEYITTGNTQPMSILSTPQYPNSKKIELSNNDSRVVLHFSDEMYSEVLEYIYKKKSKNVTVTISDNYGIGHDQMTFNASLEKQKQMVYAILSSLDDRESLEEKMKY